MRSSLGEHADHRIVADGLELLQARFEHHVFERHMHEDYAIGVTRRGVQRFWCRGAWRDGTRGDVIAIGPGEVHDGQSGTPGGYAYRMLYLSADRMANILSDAQGRRTPPFGVGAPLIRDRELASCLDLAWRAIECRPTSLAADELLDRAIVLLAERYAQARPQESSSTDRSSVARVRDYLHAEIGGRVRVAELARLAAMSRFQLSRQFQKAFGLPLHAYHLHVRLHEARRRLRNGDAVAWVAADLGFADQSHLNRRFKGAFGVTPGSWRQAARRSKSLGH